MKQQPFQSPRANELVEQERLRRRVTIIWAFTIGVCVGIIVTLSAVDVSIFW